MRDEIIYSEQKRDFIPGLRYANPRHFSGPATGVNRVIVVGDWPEVVEAYRFQAGQVTVATVENVDELAALLAKRNGASATPNVPVQRDKPSPGAAPDVALPDASEVASLAWPVVRDIAAQVSGNPIVSRRQAEAVIASERARRAAS